MIKKNKTKTRFTVSLSEEAGDYLRNKAEQTGIKISTIIEQLIRKEVNV